MSGRVLGQLRMWRKKSDNWPKVNKGLEDLPFVNDLTASFPGGSDGKEPACNAGDLGLIPGLGRSPGEGSGNLFQPSCLENPTDGGEPGGLQSMGSQRVGHVAETPASLRGRPLPSWVGVCGASAWSLS